MFQFDVEKTCKPSLQGLKNIHLFYFCVFLFLGIGIVMLYSASYSFAQRFYSNGNYFVKRQLQLAAIGLVLFLIASFIKLEFLRKFSFIFAILTAIICSLTLIPGVGVERNGATRWIQIGSFTYQPSELVKFVLPFYLAHLLDKKKDNLDKFFSGILAPIIVTGIFFTLIYIQNNFSTAIFIVFNAMIIFFLAGIKFRYFLAAIVMILPISALLVFTEEHRVWRLVSFLRPDWDPLGAGFQINASRDAIISSGFLGKGLGEGSYKIASIPEIHSDFIFSAYVEETGFLGILLFFILMLSLAFFGYRAAWKSETVFDRLLAAGLTTMLVSQMFLNIAVVSGALPATGIPLPFFSAGGSSLLTTMICAGLISNIIRTTSYEEERIRKNSFNNFSEDNDE